MDGISLSFVSLVRGVIGILFLLLLSFLLSENRRRVDFKLVGIGLLLQLLFAVAIMYVPAFSALLEGCGRVFVKLMDFTSAGLTFLLGPYASKANGFSFLIHSLPIVIFFSALVSLFYHWGIIRLALA